MSNENETIPRIRASIKKKPIIIVEEKEVDGKIVEVDRNCVIIEMDGTKLSAFKKRMAERYTYDANGKPLPESIKKSEGMEAELIQESLFETCTMQPFTREYINAMAGKGMDEIFTMCANLNGLLPDAAKAAKNS